MSETHEDGRILITVQLAVVNIGLDRFFQSLESQGVEVCQVDWKPLEYPDDEIREILNRLL